MKYLIVRKTVNSRDTYIVKRRVLGIFWQTIGTHYLNGRPVINQSLTIAHAEKVAYSHKQSKLKGTSLPVRELEIC